MRSPTRYLIVPVNMALYPSAPYYEVTHQIPYCSSQYGPVYIGSLLWGHPPDTLLFQSIWPCIHRLLIMRCPTRYLILFQSIWPCIHRLLIMRCPTRYLIVLVNMALYTSAPCYEVPPPTGYLTVPVNMSLCTYIGSYGHHCCLDTLRFQSIYGAVCIGSLLWGPHWTPQELGIILVGS